MYVHNHVLKKIDTIEDLSCVFSDLDEQQVTDFSKFKDDVWLFQDKDVDGRNRIVFSKLENKEMKILIKQVFFCEILFPTSKKIVKPATLCLSCINIQRFLDYLKNKSIINLNDVTKYDFEDHVDIIVNTLRQNNGLTLDRLYSKIQGLDLLYRNADRVHNLLSLNPIQGFKSIWDYCKHKVPKRSKHNKTIELPTSVVKNIYSCCLSYLECSEDILLHFKNWYHFRLKEVEKAKRGLVSEYHSSNSQHNYKKAIVRGIIPKPDYSPHRQILKLHASCVILIQLLTGMRRCELLALERGGLCRATGSGEQSLYAIKGFKIKGKVSPKKVKWFCPEVVAQAYTIVEQISEYVCPKSKSLIVVGNEIHTPPLSAGKPCIVAATHSRLLKNFFSDHQITDEHENLWSIKSHQFRKTYARLMADNGCSFGFLRLQLKHETIDMTAHYGDSDISRLIFDSKSDIQSTNIEKLLNSPKQVSGQGCKKIEKWSKTFNGLTSEMKKREYIRDLASTLTIQTNGIGMCVTDPTRNEKCNGAAFGSCDPTCQHLVVPMHTHKRIYEDTIHQLEDMLKLRAHNELQREQLKADLKHYKDVVKVWS